MIGDDPVRDSAADHIVGTITFARVNKTSSDVPAAIKFGHGAELGLVAEILC